RDFTYVADVAEGLLRLGLSSAIPGEIVNLATGQLTSVRQFIEIAVEALNFSGERLRFGALPTRTGEMEHAPAALGRVKGLIGWIPPTGIRAGIRDAIEFTAAMKEQVDYESAEPA